MDHYPIGLTAGILDAKHVRALGPAVWLYAWFVRKQTKRAGAVLGGAVLQLGPIQRDLGVSRRTIQRWLRTLTGENPEGIVYVEIADVPGAGFTARVARAKKWKHEQAPPD